MNTPNAQGQGGAGSALTAGLGSLGDPVGAGRGEIRLPGWLPTRGDYFIRGASAIHPALTGATPPFSILAFPALNAARPGGWTGYR